MSATTLAELAASDAVCAPHTPTESIGHLFDQDADLPGVLIAEADKLYGFISRTAFFNRLSRPFALELFLKRPIRAMLEVTDSEGLVLPEQTPISAAVDTALRRDNEHIYDPIIVQNPEGGFGIINMQQLLLALNSQLEQAKQEIDRQREAERAANEAKSQFLANMSHEIRTPLTAIIGFAEDLYTNHGSVKENQLSAQTIVRNGQHLLSIINDILDLSKIEAGRVELEYMPTNIAELTHEVVSVLGARAREKGLELNLRTSTPVPELIQTDPTRVRQILFNLIGNSIKFTSQGSVDLLVSVERESMTSVRISFGIQDTGIGMSEEQLERLFKPFTQADQSTTRKFGGTGLGLTISRQLARMMGGDVTAQSELEVGSCFLVTLQAHLVEPVRWHANLNDVPSTPKPEREDQKAMLSGMKVLLVEDSPDNRLLITRMIENFDAQIETAENGKLGVEAVLSAPADSPYDVILMDVQMPIMDGMTATRALRDAGVETPIIALTANAMKAFEQECYEAGFNGFCSKPINRQKLFDLIHDLTHSAESQTRTAYASLPAHEASPAIVPQTTETSSTSHIRTSVALERTGGDAELLQEIYQLVLDSCREWLEALPQSIAQENWKETRRLAHSLKNSADNLGATEVVKVCDQLEKAAYEKRSHDVHHSFTLLGNIYEEMLLEVTQRVS